MEKTVFWDAAPYGMAQVYRRFLNVSCLRDADNGGSKHHCNVGELLRDYTAQRLRRRSRKASVILNVQL
jgi:hypothetical protein